MAASAAGRAAKAEDAGASRRRWRDDMSLTDERLLETHDASARFNTHVAAADALGLEVHTYVMGRSAEKVVGKWQQK